MSLEYIRKTYNVPAKRGTPVRYGVRGVSQRDGVITGSSGSYIRVRLYGDKRSKIYHPTWHMEYL